LHWRSRRTMVLLVSRLQALLHQGQLKIRRSLPEAGILVRELQDFRVEYTASGHLTFNARQGRHDDLVLALAIACWRAHGGGVSYGGLLEFMARGNSPSAPARYSMQYAHRVSLSSKFVCYGAVRPCPPHRYFRPRSFAACTFSLGIAGQVLKFRTRARTRVMPPIHRAPRGQ
jgi:hypothetical protein